MEHIEALVKEMLQDALRHCDFRPVPHCLHAQEDDCVCRPPRHRAGYHTEAVQALAKDQRNSVPTTKTYGLRQGNKPPLVIHRRSTLYSLYLISEPPISTTLMVLEIYDIPAS